MRDHQANDPSPPDEHIDAWRSPDTPGSRRWRFPHTPHQSLIPPKEFRARHLPLPHVSEILVLRQQLDWFKRRLFGRKSEQLEHPELFEKPAPGKAESSDGVDTPAEDDESEKTPARRVRKRPIRSQRLPEDLPRETEIVVPPEVLADPGKWKLLGEEERKWLEKEPGHFYLRVKIYQTYVPIDEPVTGKAVTAAAAPSRVRKARSAEEQQPAGLSPPEGGHLKATHFRRPLSC